MHVRVSDRVILLLPLKLPGFRIELGPRVFSADTHAHANNMSSRSYGGGGNIISNNGNIISSRSSSGDGIV